MTTMTHTTPTYDQATAEDFLGRMASLIDGGAVVTMMAIGHRLKLFDTMAGLPPASSADIARAANLNERYVREWLAVMVMGRIVEYDAQAKTYALPAEHAACLTTEAPLGNMAVYTQHVALLGQVQEHLLRCFKTGEGMRYEDYPCFHQIMAEDSGQTVAAQIDAIVALVEGLSDRLREGIDVLDAGCGRGGALRALATRYPRSRFVGYDLSAEATSAAQADAEAAGLTNVTFEARDLTGYDERGRFDLVTTFDAVHDQAHPQALIQSLHDALRPGGTYLMQDVGGSARLEQNVDFPMAAMLYAISCAHCMPVSLGQGGEGLGTMWGWETAQAMLERAGFADVTKHVFPHDPMNVWFVARR